MKLPDKTGHLILGKLAFLYTSLSRLVTTKH